MDFKMDKKAMAKLEKDLTKTVSVPTTGSESAAAAAVKRDYQKQTGAKMSDAAARKLAREARGK